MFSFISPSRRSYVENGPIYYPFGGKLSRNVLKDYKGPQNREIKAKIMLTSLCVLHYNFLLFL